MIILLDENLLSKKLKQPFLNQGYEVYNVNDMGWRGLKDKEIINLAENHPFDVFITADKNLPYQQNLSNSSLKVIVLNTSSTNPKHILPLIQKVSRLINDVALGVVLIDDTGNITKFEFQ
ncbi:hypothetical protein Cyast_0638 [Cyanobacterium stanieri PCC 7202]|uniref:DUF5615 domain-containing protein n=1 Tax=Cyanobacterium stanieri (strain ATCC 29140 / PCC 7202) TaxID=292563 RepID=K9YIC6_CYASC|nr:hypothetical protein Cyast_0638 [Cyanobacterium stanieri PCC 7202]